VSNALKFVYEGGLVQITAHYNFETRELVLRVRDDGPGIAPEDRPYVFERFVQGHDGAAHNHGGSGLGLAVVKELAELHGGRVELSCAEVGNCTFTVWLPATYE
jgi:signal transduction histidine kinase